MVSIGCEHIALPDHIPELLFCYVILCVPFRFRYPLNIPIFLLKVKAYFSRTGYNLDISQDIISFFKFLFHFILWIESPVLV